MFRGASEGTIRQYLIKDINVIDAIIGLPANCFQGTSIPVCCIVLKKERNGNSDNICFIDASKEFEKGKQQNYITEEHIDKIVNAYSERRDIDKYCHIASLEEIAENDYNLNIPRYVDTSEEEEEIKLDDIFTEINNIDSELQSCATELEKSFAELGISFNGKLN